MKKISLFMAKDGRLFTSEDICKQYEAEKAKHPDDPGIIYYNKRGKETDDFDYAMGYKVTNSIIANAIVNSFSLSKIIKETICTEVGCYAFISNDGVHIVNEWVPVSEEDLHLLITH